MRKLRLTPKRSLSFSQYIRIYKIEGPMDGVTTGLEGIEYKQKAWCQQCLTGGLPFPLHTSDALETECVG